MKPFAWMAFGLFIFTVAFLRMQTGFAIDRAFPVPVYMEMSFALPHDAYVQAVDALDHASANDGEAGIAAAEADALSGASPSVVIARVSKGLRQSPASARGWTILADADLAANKRVDAAKAISNALLLSPFDYWLAGKRARAAAALLDDLDRDTRAAADRQAELLWDTPELRREIPALLRSPGGERLMTEAVGGNPQKVRALDRWLASERRRLQGLGT